MSNGDSKWYQNADARGWGNVNYYDDAQEYNPLFDPNKNPNYGKSFVGVGRFDYNNLNRLPSNLTQDLGASNYLAPPPKEEIINQDTRLDVNNNLPITPHIPRPGKDWPGFGILRALGETGFRMKGGDYYSQKFPSREFTEGDRTYNQRGLAGYYHPDEVFNMQQFGGVGEYGDPRKDKFGKNIVSFADDYEEGIEDWVNKYGKRHSTDPGFLKRRANKIAMWNKIQERRKGIEDANRRASDANLARAGITHSGQGGGGSFIDPGGRDRGGQGAFQENVAQMRGAGRSYTDAQGNVGYSSGRAEGGRIGYNRGRVVNPGGYQGDEFEDENVLEFMQDQGIPHSQMAETSPFEMRIQQLMDEGMSWEEAYEIASQEFATAEGGGESFNEEGIASLV